MFLALLVILSPKHMITPTSNGKIGFHAQTPSTNKNISFNDGLKSDRKHTERTTSTKKSLSKQKSGEVNSSQPLKTEGDAPSQEKVEEAKPQEETKEVQNEQQEEQAEVKQEKPQQIEEDIPDESNRNWLVAIKNR